MPLVSILIPAYNSAKYISECIESAINQTYPEKEVIVIDDGSTDATFQIASKFNSEFIKVYRQHNLGASAARNKALQLAKGDYIQWLDSDDILEPDKVSRQVNCIKDPLDLLSGPFYSFVTKKNKIKMGPNSLWEDLLPVEWLYRKMNENLWFPPMVFLVSRELTNLAGKWDENLSRNIDGEYFDRIISKSKRIQFVENAISFKRDRLGSISSVITLNDDKLNSLHYTLLNSIQQLLQLEDSERTRDASCKLLNRWAECFYPNRMDLYEKMLIETSRLGGILEKPRLRPKYRLLQYIVGSRVAKKAQFILPALKLLLRQHLQK